METFMCDKKYENFPLGKKSCEKNKVHGVLSKVTLKGWSNFYLIATKTILTDSSTSQYQ
jgi:hypothetical protein